MTDIDTIDQRLARIEAARGEFDHLFDRLERRLDTLDRMLDELIACMIALERRLDRRGIGPDSHTRWRAFNDGLTDGVQLGRQLSPTSAGGAA
jgi:hypothetical protein